MGIEEAMAIAISVIFFFLYILGIVFLCGKGGIAVAGYHFEPKGEESTKYHKFIMRRMGIWYLFIVLLLHICVIFGLFGHLIACFCALGALVLIGVLGILYFNFNKKIKQARQLEKQLSYENDIKKIKNNNK